MTMEIEHVKYDTAVNAWTWSIRSSGKEYASGQAASGDAARAALRATVMHILGAA